MYICVSILPTHVLLLPIYDINTHYRLINYHTGGSVHIFALIIFIISNVLQAKAYYDESTLTTKPTGD